MGAFRDIPIANLRYYFDIRNSLLPIYRGCGMTFATVLLVRK